MSHFARAPQGRRITGIAARAHAGLFYVTVRTEDAASWVTWQTGDLKWTGAADGWVAGFQHFAAKP
jgi:hypothetical protein